MNLQLTGNEVMLGLLSLTFLLTFGIIAKKYLRNLFSNTPNQAFETSISIAERTKYASVSFMRKRSHAFGIGMVCSLLFAILTMSWTTYERTVHVAPDYGPTDETIDIIIPPLPKPPEIPKPKEVKVEVVEDVPEEDIKDLPELDVDIDDSFDFDTPVEDPVEAPVAPPPPLPEKKEDVIDIFKVVEQMPRFGDCSDKACSDKALMTYISKTLKYPAFASENGIQGRVTAEFVVEKDGSMSAIKILRGIGAGCDKEVLRVLGKMSSTQGKWTPGMQRGKPVRVLFRVPVTFKLN